MRRIASLVLWFLVLSIPIENSVVIPGVGTLTRLIGIGATLATILAVIASNRMRRLNWVHFLMAAFIMDVTASYFWSQNPDLSLERIITYVQLFPFAWMIWELAQERAQQKSLLAAYAIGAAVAAIWTIRGYLAGPTTVQDVNDVRYVAWGFDPNDLGLMLALAIPMVWYLAGEAKGHLQAWLWRMTLVVLVASILLTSSRGSAIAMAAAIAYVPWTFRSMTLRARGAVIGAGLVVLYLGLPYVPETSLQRLSTIRQEIAQGQLNHRTAIWKIALAEFAKEPMSGVGAGAFRANVDSSYVAHNAFISVLVEQGLPGFLLFIGIIGLLLASVPRMPIRDRPFWVFLILTWSIGVLALSWEYRKPTWLLFALMACYADAPQTAGQVANSDARLRRHELVEGDRS